jgi:hypothetical protein
MQISNSFIASNLSTALPEDITLSALLLTTAATIASVKASFSALNTVHTQPAQRARSVETH